jgi:hypothetical protein
VRPKHFRFGLALVVLCSAFLFLAHPDEDDVTAGCLECATERTGLVDVYNPVPLIPAYISFSDNAGTPEFANVKVDGLGYRSFYLPKGYFFWKAYWLNLATEEILDMDWGRVRIAPGSKAAINLNPKSYSK